MVAGNAVAFSTSRTSFISSGKAITTHTSVAGVLS
jgi:hypothetical protein